MKRPLFVSAVIAVILSVTVFHLKHGIVLGLPILAPFLMSALKGRARVNYCIVLLCSAIMLISLSVSLLKEQRFCRLDNSNITESLVITESPVQLNSRFYADAVSLSGNALKKGDKIRLYYKNADICAGDVVSADITVKSVANSDKRMRLYSEGIYAIANVKNMRYIGTKSILCIIPKLRRSINEVLNQSPVSYDAKAVISALTLGDKSGFSHEFDYLVKASGTSHIMVVSGMHLMIIMGALIRLLERIFYNKYLFAAISLGSVLFLAALCGFTMSVLRAGIMYLTVAAAPLFSRDSDTLNTLGFALFLILCFSPFAIFNISLQLSVLSTLGILLFTDYLAYKICLVFRITLLPLKNIVELISVTVAATVTTAPVCILTFGYISLTAIITNLLLTYAVSACLVLSAVGIALGLLSDGALSSPVIGLAGIFAQYTDGIIRYFGSLKFAVLPLGKASAVVLTVVAALLILIMYIDNLKTRKIKRNLI